MGYLRIRFHFLIWTEGLLFIGEIDRQVARSGGQNTDMTNSRLDT